MTPPWTHFLPGRMSRVLSLLLVPSACCVSTVALPASVVAGDVSHHQIHIEGKGARTVILESGLGDTLAIWKDIQPRIADHCTRTISYSRAGYVGSDPASGPRDAATIVSELRQELRSSQHPTTVCSSAIRLAGSTCSTSRAIIRRRSRVCYWWTRLIGTRTW